LIDDGEWTVSSRQNGENNKGISSESLYISIRAIIEKSRKNVHLAVNTAMVEAYWYIGKTLIEDEQQGESRAEYGKQIIADISHRLTTEFGKGFSAQNLWNMRQFYRKFSSVRRELKIEEDVEILSALRRELSWTHFKVLLRVEKPKACIWHMKDKTIVKYSVLNENKQLFASKYMLYLPSEEELAMELEKEARLIEMEMADQSEVSSSE
jgi:hypothetical protein